MSESEKSILAAEFALDLLGEEDRREVVRLLAVDPLMPERCRYWRAYFSDFPHGADGMSRNEEIVSPPRDTHRVHDQPLLDWFLDEICSPDNRGIVAAAVILKVAAIAWLVTLV